MDLTTLPLEALLSLKTAERYESLVKKQSKLEALKKGMLIDEEIIKRIEAKYVN
jgi:hypothetical protein